MGPQSSMFLSITKWAGFENITALFFYFYKPFLMHSTSKIHGVDGLYVFSILNE